MFMLVAVPNAYDCWSVAYDISFESCIVVLVVSVA